MAAKTITGLGLFVIIGLAAGRNIIYPQNLNNENDERNQITSYAQVESNAYNMDSFSPNIHKATEQANDEKYENNETFQKNEVIEDDPKEFLKDLLNEIVRKPLDYDDQMKEVSEELFVSESKLAEINENNNEPRANDFDEHNYEHQINWGIFDDYFDSDDDDDNDYINEIDEKYQSKSVAESEINEDDKLNVPKALKNEKEFQMHEVSGEIFNSELEDDASAESFMLNENNNELKMNDVSEYDTERDHETFVIRDKINDDDYDDFVAKLLLKKMFTKTVAHSLDYENEYMNQVESREIFVSESEDNVSAKLVAEFNEKNDKPKTNDVDDYPCGVIADYYYDDDNEYNNDVDLFYDVLKETIESDEEPLLQKTTESIENDPKTTLDEKTDVACKESTEELGDLILLDDNTKKNKRLVCVVETNQGIAKNDNVQPLEDTDEFSMIFHPHYYALKKIPSILTQNFLDKKLLV